MDVSKDEEVKTWIDDSVRTFGRLDGCANVAGIAGGDGNTTTATIARYNIPCRGEKAYYLDADLN